VSYNKILRILSVAFILSLLVTVLPVAPVKAAEAITISPSQGAIGTRVTVTASGFPVSGTTDRFAVVYLSNQSGTIASRIGINITVYEKVSDVIWIDESGNFTTYFNIPSVMDDGTTSGSVTGGTYYIYATYYLSVNPPTVLDLVRAIATFTITAGTMTITPTNGTVGTEVKITGSNFVASQAITFKWDDTTLAVTSGNSSTTSTGIFNTYIAIPESPSGAHTISAIVSGYEAAATFTVKPKATFAPTSGDADSTVKVTGTGFTRRKEVVIYFNANKVAAATSDANGSFTAEFKVPKLNLGSYDLEADDGAGNLVSIKFRITGTTPAPSPAPSPTPTPQPTPTPAAPTVTVNPTKGFIGTEVVVGGVGFKENATVTVKFDDKDVASVKAGTQGIVIAIFRVPAGKSGDHTITITDGTKTEKITFKLEATLPPTPQPVTPEMGVKVKKDFSFDWRDVTTDNPPVTYVLQMATSQEFTSSSLVIEKKGLSKSEYAPTKEEAAKLAGRDTPYYWRIRAVDAGENESNWTGAGQFYVPKPFSLPNWANWLAIVVGALVLLFIGYWVGRRSAYSY